MAKKITELPALPSLDAGDLVPAVDATDATTKQMTATQLRTRQVDPKLAGYTLQATDCGKTITIDAAGPVDVTVPALGAGFWVEVIQLGAGQVTFVVSGTTLRNRQSHTKVAGQYGRVGLTFHAGSEFTLFGDTAA